MENKISSKYIEVKLDELYLDPNNYRFVDDTYYLKVKEEDIKKDSIQARTRHFIEGEKREGIRDLLASFRANGFLKVDVIQLKKIGEKEYLVIEGNRRTAALKCLFEDYSKGLDIGVFNPENFKSVPAELYDDADKYNQLIVMGLKHISGNKKWAPINQSKMIYDFLSKYPIRSTEYEEQERVLVNSLGITLNKLRGGQRAYHFVQAYKRSDFGEQFTSEKYSFFEEAMKRPAIRQWLGWSEETYQSENKTNEERFFSWISKIEESETDFDFGDLDDNPDGDISFSTVMLDPIITKSSEIRQLALFIDNSEKIRLMEEKRNVYAVLNEAPNVGRDTVENAKKNIADSLGTLKRYEDILDDDDINELKSTQEQLDVLLPSKNGLGITFFNYNNKYDVDYIHHFSEINLTRFKKMSNNKLSELGKINIFVGPNNSGKTTLLEALYLLCNLNDINGLLTLSEMRLRGERITTGYLNNLIDYNICIDGIFNSNRVTVGMKNVIDSQIDKKDDYISTIRIDTSITDAHTTENNSFEMHMYVDNPVENKYSKIVHICRNAYTSPFYIQKDFMREIYDDAIRVKHNGETVFSEIIRFIQENVDPTINNIILGSDDRFVVDSSKFSEKNVELYSYGAGVERIFEIALNVAYCRNGVLLIDEVDSGIHYSLLIEFTRFLQKLCNAFNTQLFITTHSKECVDAFVRNEYNNQDVMYYKLSQNDEDEVNIKHVNGDEFKSLIDLFDTDIRGRQI